MLKPAVNIQSLADQVLLQQFSPAAVLVNSTGDILYISGMTGNAFFEFMKCKAMSMPDLKYSSAEITDWS